ncbi:lipoprotein-releasing system permease protein [Litorivivens lipolytica]|uniref:Lipoprotein-releasing system permease protein n=1 Tax=Litorivivens lipolytica TaxID=1524264 RepID=A0A7W4W2L8_9GAMM|nr:lipoprotein-releasing ABC transporter permease subunit [Litorivivens lipolytica]MBB3046298.1 lipoprotein-releasing system permease protein [Litorivivens lipolytica]
MAWSYPIRIGFRYFFSRRRDRFLSVVTWISLLGMAVGITSLIVVMSVMNGFEAELRNRVLSLVPHGFVDGPDRRLEDWSALMKTVSEQSSVRGVSPYTGTAAMLVRGDRLRGIQLYGIDPATEGSVSDIEQQMVDGNYLDKPRFEILLGDILARRLQLTVGDRVTLVLPTVTVTPLGLFPQEKTLEVAGIFSAGADVDGNTAFVHLKVGQRLLRLGNAVNGLRVEFDDLFAAPEELAKLANLLPAGVETQSWAQTQGSLFQAVKMEKRMVRLLLFFIVVIAAFNIISILTMAVSQRRPAIAVLRTMGATPTTIVRIFLVYGLLTAVLGIALGALIGVPVAMNVSELIAFLESSLGMKVFNPDVYFISAIPSVFRWLDFALIVSVALALSVLATLYPAWQSARIEPAEALRYD